MDYRTLHIKTVVELRKLAKEMQLKVPAGTSKAHLVEMLAEAGARQAAASAAPAQTAAQPDTAPAESAAPRKRGRPRKNPLPSQEPSPGPATEPVAESAQEASPPEPAAPEPAAAIETPAAPDAPASRQERRIPEPQRPAVSRGEYGKFARTHAQRPITRERISLREDRRDNTGSYVQRSADDQSQRSHSGYFQRNNAEYTPRQVPRPAPAPRPAAAQSEAAPASQGDYNTTNQAVLDMLAAGEVSEGAGVLEIHPDGYGFLRAENYLPGANDTYVSIAQIHRFALRTGDYVEGKTRPQREGDRYNAMVYINRVNGLSPEQNARRRPFESLVPIYPDQRLRLESEDGKPDLALRLIDMLAPIGKGQRGMIVSQPKAGKTTLLKKLANSITASHPEIHLIVLLIDERPEEVTDMKRSISGEVVFSTFDEAPENHTRVSEMVLERAQRLVEQGKDVVVLLDSITRLARAYNLVIPPTGRSLSGGLDPGALHKPKRFFGAARNIENGGSLTIIATALVDTGSRMDDIIFEEFKGTGNMELHLDRKLSDRRIFPAIDLYRSGTRREELLLSPAELDGEYQVRRMLGSSGNQETVEQLIGMLEKTSSNAEFFSKLKGWVAAFEKDGFSMSNGKR